MKNLSTNKPYYYENELEDVASNLSDFALFLTVMKRRKAYQNTLSIILDEPNIHITQVKVEQVILNKSGKRAIRLDAWAQSEDDRLFDMEMQNNSDQDSLPKRSRFYQGLMDVPILKSGKKTKYRHLPSTTIIFITFTEQCEEIKDLKLEDGTKKIFLNMTSKNGSKELISLLNYMKNTNINNPEIIVKDKRLLELDNIVSEVKESEEWEAVKMDILDIGINKGISQGINQGEIKKLILQVSRKKAKNIPVKDIADMLEEDSSLIQNIYDALNKYDAETDWEKIVQIVTSIK